MNRRTYDRVLQAEQSERIRTDPPPEWREFSVLWMALNALYNTVEDQRSEAEQVRRIVGCLRREEAEELLEQLEEPIKRLCEAPPGDMRFTAENDRFSELTERQANEALDIDAAPRDRIGSVLVIVYQVRCNLLHGNKDPERDRDVQLVRTANQILRTVLPALETAMRSA